MGLDIMGDESIRRSITLERYTDRPKKKPAEIAVYKESDVEMARLDAMSRRIDRALGI